LEGVEAISDMNDLQQPSVPSEIHYHNDTVYTPRVGGDENGPRVGTLDVGR